MRKDSVEEKFSRIHCIWFMHTVCKPTIPLFEIIDIIIMYKKIVFYSWKAKEGYVGLHKATSQSHLKWRPCRTDRTIARPIGQGRSLRFSREDQTFEVNKLFSLLHDFLGNQSARANHTGYKYRPYINTVYQVMLQFWCHINGQSLVKQ